MQTQLLRSRPLMFAYWGRRGALPQFTLNVASALLNDTSMAASLSVSRQSENFSAYSDLRDALLPVDTFTSGAGALLSAPRILGIRKALKDRFRTDETEALVELMPHVWSPFIMPMVQRQGVQYCPIIHDANAHPGDPTAFVKPLLDRVIRHADHIITLSSAVRDQLVKRGLAPERISTLYHPDLTFSSPTLCQPPKSGEPWKLLFLGRIMPYKGLPMLLDAVDELRRRGVNIALGVFGDGDLGSNMGRLRALGANVVNRWLTHEEVGAALSSHHVVILSHTEASQSGVAAAALGASVPIVATPVGGLVGQITNGHTGMIAQSVDAAALAHAIEILVSDPALYSRIRRNIADEAVTRSMPDFVRKVTQIALGDRAS